MRKKIFLFFLTIPSSLAFAQTIPTVDQALEALKKLTVDVYESGDKIASSDAVKYSKELWNRTPETVHGVAEGAAVAYSGRLGFKAAKWRQKRLLKKLEPIVGNTFEEPGLMEAEQMRMTGKLPDVYHSSPVERIKMPEYHPPYSKSVLEEARRIRHRANVWRYGVGDAAGLARVVGWITVIYYGSKIIKDIAFSPSWSDAKHALLAEVDNVVTSGDETLGSNDTMSSFYAENVDTFLRVAEKFPTQAEYLEYAKFYLDGIDGMPLRTAIVTRSTSQ